MSYFQRLLLLITATLALSNLSFAGEPRNLGYVKQDLMRYHDSGEYQKDIARVDQQALAYLKARIAKEKKKPSGKKLAIVLDIDETALSNYPDMVAMDFGGTLKDVEDAEGKGTDPVIQPTLELYQDAKANGVAVFFITARKAKYRDGTASNLEAAGYKDYEDLYLIPNDYHEKSVTPFKAGIRKEITDKGYDIVLNLSDQKGDLRGGFADKAFKLPDPFYLVP